LLIDRNLFAVTAKGFKTDGAVNLGEEGVIAAPAHVGAGVDVGPALADQNGTREDVLAIGTLRAKALALGVTTVLCGANAFFMGEKLKTNLQHIA